MGFRLIDERDRDQWQGGVREQHFELASPGDPIAG
jgi:hypothetical protein